MILTNINAALAKLKLPPIDAAQLELVDAAGELEALKQAVLRTHANDLTPAGYLELIVRSIAPSVPATLARLGIAYVPRLFIQAAKHEKMALFAALHAIRSRKPTQDAAIDYIRALGFPPLENQPRDDAAVTPPYYSFKIFGQAAALCISEARTVLTQEHTIQIEGALAFGDGSRKFDWQGKIIIQLTLQEMALLLAVLKRMLASVKFEGHGRQHDKALYLEYQQTHFYVRLVQRGRAAVSLPVKPVDAMPIVTLIYKQMMRNAPHLHVEQLTQLVAEMAAMMQQG